MRSFSSIAIPKLGFGMDQTNWQEVVRILRDIFAFDDVQIVVYTLGENGVHALSADDEIERYSEEFLLENRELETVLLKILKPANQLVRNNSPFLARKMTTIDSFITIFNTSLRI